MKLPMLKETKTVREMTSTFYGYNHNPKIRDGEWFDMTNMSGANAPLLSCRKKRGILTTVPAPGGITAKDAIAYVSGSTLVFDGYAVEMGLSAEVPKQLISMGAYLVIFPDKKYINTQKLTDYGSLEASVSISSGNFVTYSPCDITGNAYGNLQITKPDNPANGELWLDTAAENHVIKRFSAASGMWVSIPTVYTKIEASNIGTPFKEGDGVNIAGCAYAPESATLKKQIEGLNGCKLIVAKGDHYIVVVGLVDQVYTQTAGTVSVARKTPDMDYVCEAQNRLWGCKYGMVDGKSVNEVYCCKLGDFKNWNSFAGIATDAWAASLGSDGPFTGAANYLGYPCFFKEQTMHRISVSSSGAHQVMETKCQGVQKGSWRSLSVVGGILYYKAMSGIMAYDGSLPVSVSEELGDISYHEAVAGGVGNRYYISMQAGDGTWALFCYDTKKGLWYKEDNEQVMMFAACDDDLCFINAGGKLLCIDGTKGTAEETITWAAETGMLYYAYPDKKYASRYDFRMSMEAGASMKMQIQYDSDGVWVDKGSVTGTGTGTFTLPVVPRRCDHMRIRLSGTGECRIYSIARILEQGSDM